MTAQTRQSGKFINIFAKLSKFLKVFRSFRRFGDVFGPVQTYSGQTFLPNCSGLARMARSLAVQPLVWHDECNEYFDPSPNCHCHDAVHLVLSRSCTQQPSLLRWVEAEESNRSVRLCDGNRNEIWNQIMMGAAPRSMNGGRACGFRWWINCLNMLVMMVWWLQIIW